MSTVLQTFENFALSIARFQKFCNTYCKISKDCNKYYKSLQVLQYFAILLEPPLATSIVKSQIIATRIVIIQTYYNNSCKNSKVLQNVKIIAKV